MDQDEILYSEDKDQHCRIILVAAQFKNAEEKRHIYKGGKSV